jgi:hypothetical protein
MTVQKLIAELEQYNPQAEVCVILANHLVDFTISFGVSEGSTPLTAEMVGLRVEGANTTDAKE